MAKKAGFKSRFIFLLRSMALIKRRLDMLDKLNNQWPWLIFLLPGILFPLRIAFAAGGISTDGTVGPARTLNGANVDIPQNLGTTVGKNLFHSFSEFNVNNGQTVTFRENTQNTLDNVVSRVTGGSRSDINGTLRSTPGGHANLYLVNPSGLMFGPNARIDVAGTFHASTADEVRFQDGAKFSASQPSGSTLTAAAPASFGFLGTSAATNGFLKVDGAQLAAKPEQKLGMVGGNISVENDAKLSAPAGEVRLEAVGTGSLNIPIAQPSEAAHGALALTKSSSIDASGEGGGKVIVRGRDLNMDQNAKILAKTNGKKNGDGIDVRLTGNMKMRGGSLVQAGTTGNGASGKILVTAKNLQIDGQNTITGIGTEAGNHSAIEEHSTGRAGDIELHIANQLSLARSGQINSSSFSTGDAGNITVKTGQLLTDGQDAQNLFQTGIFSSAAREWSGKGGNIDVSVQGDIHMKGGGSLIQAGTSGTGASGKIVVTAENLLIDGQNSVTGIGTESWDSVAMEKHSTGRAGDIELRIANQLSLTRSGQINSSSYSTGDAGNITVKTGQLLTDGQDAQNLFQTGIFSSAAREWSGSAGSINVSVQGDMNIKGGGMISASTSGSHNAGNITVDIENLSLIRGGQIITSTFGTGDAGSVTAKVGQLLIDGQGALINSFGPPLQTGIFAGAGEASSGKGGNIAVIAQGDINMKGGSEISASAPGNGTAGDVLVTAKNLLVDGQMFLNGEKLHFPTLIASTAGSEESLNETNGNAGSIMVDIANRLSLIRGGQIGSSSFGTGDAGSITAKAGQLLIDGQGELMNYLGTPLQTGIFTAAAGTESGGGGDIVITVRNDMNMKGGGIISASTSGNHNAGNIKAGSIKVSTSQFSLDTESIVTTESVNGNGGDIAIQGGQLIQLINSGFTTSVLGQQSGDGGNISVDAENLVMETGLIQANTTAPNASGGNIKLDLKGLIPSGQTLILGGDQPVAWQPYEFGLNVIQAAAPNGVSGVIQSTAPQLNLSGVLANLGGPQFDTSVISQDYCALGTGSSLIRQGKGGLLPRSRDSVMY
jgi:filamentous hemagglutinin family protein